MYNTVSDFVCREPSLWVTMKKILMRPFPGKISTSNMPLKWRHETNEMVTNNTMMGWNNNSDEDNLSAKTIINCTMPTGTWLPPQCMKRLVLKIKLGTSIPTHRWRIKLVNMVNSFSYCSWITYKTQQVLKIKSTMHWSTKKLSFLCNIFALQEDFEFQQYQISSRAQHFTIISNGKQKLNILIFKTP